MTTRTLRLAGAAALLTPALIGLTSATAATSTPPATAAPVTVAVHPETVLAAVPPRFLGLSAEPANACALARLGEGGGAFPQLLANLGPGVLRIGGNTVERVRWSPEGAGSCSYRSTTLTPSLVDRTLALPEAVGWTATWPLRLQTPEVAESAAQAAYVAGRGRTVTALEIGNEPDLYGRSAEQTMADWRSTYDAVRRAGVTLPVDGPAVSWPQSAYVDRFLAREHTSTGTVTAHRYFGAASDTTPQTAAGLLSASTARRTRTSFAALVQEARSYGLPASVNESGSYVHYGQQGVSDSFAAALWGSDYLFLGLESGVRHVAFHGVPNDPAGNRSGLVQYYGPVRPDTTATPLYYAMLLFRQATQAGGAAVGTSTTSREGVNLTSHAVLGADGALRVLLVNKDLTRDASTVVALPQAYTRAEAVRLAAPSVSATSGVTLGGRSVAADGSWSPDPAAVQAVRVASGRASVAVPAGSEVTLTFR